MKYETKGFWFYIEKYSTMEYASVIIIVEWHRCDPSATWSFEKIYITPMNLSLFEVYYFFFLFYTF